MNPVALSFAPWLAVGWWLGTGLQLQQATLWSFQRVLVGLLGSALIGACLWGAQTHMRHWPAIFTNTRVAMRMLGLRIAWGAMACLMALSFVNARSWQQAQDALKPSLEGVDLRVVGEVMSLPQKGSLGVRFHLHPISAKVLGREEEVQVPQRIALSWFAGEAADPLDTGPSGELMAGDLWHMTVRLKRPHGHMNPHGFDEELWLWEQGVMATGTVRAGKQDMAPRKIKGTWRYPVALVRQMVRDRMDRERMALSPLDRSTFGAIEALVMGDQAAIAASDWDVFRATGVAHLMSISGLHISLFAWLAARLIGFVWRSMARRGHAFCLKFPAPVVSALGGLLLATLYALFSGWGLPAQRTIVMLCAVGCLRLMGAQWPWLWVWGFALWWVALWDPWAFMQAGFWLSFVAVGVLSISMPASEVARTKMATEDAEMVHQSLSLQNCINMVSGLKEGVGRLLREQWVMTLALTPLMILYFGQVSLVGLLANLVAIPWVTWVVTPLAMLGMIWPPLWHLALWTLQPLMQLLVALAQMPEGVWHLPHPPLVLAVAAVGGGVCLLQKWPWHLRAWGLPLLLPVFLWQAPKPAWGQFELWAADVGQGNAALLRTANHALLYDTGAKYSETSNAGLRVLVPLMSSLGIQLDRLMLSHRDSDHTGGAAVVLAAHPKADVWSSIEPSHPLALLRPITRCEAGQRWEWDGVRFEVLHPQLSDYVSAVSSNAVSCVLRVDASQEQKTNFSHDRHSGSALLNGDIEWAQEQTLLTQAQLKPVDYFLVPHHGSQTSSSLAFVQASQPRWAVVQAGYLNRYGHPAAKVVARYQSLDVPWVQTANCGAAYWQSHQPDKLGCERDLARRYWHFVAK